MSKVEYKNSVDAIAFKVFGIFDLFRSNHRLGFIEDQIHVVLLFISLYKDGFFNTNTVDSKSLLDAINNSNEDSSIPYPSHRVYRDVIQILNNSLIKIDRHSFEYIRMKLYEIDRNLLTDIFPQVFDNVLYRISQSEGRYAGEFIQPVELTRFICGLVSVKKNAKVFNPFAGLASFGVYLDQGLDYFGQELNQRTWTLGALRLLAYDRMGNSKYVWDDSLLHWPKPSEKFDLIVANPPLGMKLGRKYEGIDYEYRTVEPLLIEKGLRSLKQNGKLVVLLPQGFLFRGMGEQRLREHLIEEDVIETIISLPGGLLLNTGIPIVILVLNKAKRIPGKVQFIDAKNFVLGKGPREKVLNDHALNNIVHNITQDVDFIRVVDNREIRANEYNLNVPRYFQKQIEGVKLGEILELIRGQRGNLPDKGKLIRMRDLKDDKVDFTLDVGGIGETSLGRNDINLIGESCLLIAMRWKTLKPTLFEFKGEPIFRSHDILSFKVNESLADKAYLINELHANYVREQLESFRLGAAVIPFIRKDDLMKVVIKLPSLEEQRAKVQGIYELSDKIKNLQAERNALAHGKFINQFNEFASLKHTLGRPRQNILDWSDNLLDFLNKNREGFDQLNKAFAEFYDIDMISVLKEIKRDVNFMTDVLERGENGLVLSEYEKQIITLSDINSIINELSNNGFNFKIKKLLLKSEKLKERGVFANRTLFKTLLDNILTNAYKYAFDQKSLGNEVVIELTEVDDFLSIEIKNNGKPFPRNYGREKFVTKYSTADSSNGSGLGGYDINRIATYFDNPDWTLCLNEDPFFPVKFKFQFPIKLIN